MNDSTRLQEAGECAFVMPVSGTLEIGGYALEEGRFAVLSPSAPNASPVTTSTTVVVIELGNPRL